MTREEAIDCFVHPTQHWTSEREEAIKMAIEALKCVQGWEELADDLTHKAPTMDVVEVVRCKDCKFRTEADEGGLHWCLEAIDCPTKADGFCWLAKHK